MRWLALVCLLLLGGAAQAQTWRELDILLLPGPSYQPLGEVLFTPAAPPSNHPDFLHYLHGQLAQLDLVTPHALDTLSHSPAFPSDLRRTRLLAQERFEMGLAAWKALSPQDAVAHFERSGALHREAFTDLLAPQLLAEVELYRGLALLDLGEQGLAHLALAQSMFYDPAQRFEPGYYGAQVEERLLAAANELTRATDLLSIRFSAERLGSLGQALKRDYILVHLHTQQPEGLLIQVGLFDVRLMAYAFRIQTRADQADLSVPHALSAWQTCALEVTRTLIRKREQAPWGLELGYTHHVWLHHRPTRHFLHGPGVSLGLNRLLNPNLELWSSYRQRVTFKDANTDLLDVLTSGHLSAGLGLIVGSERVRFSLRLGFELALSYADITATTDVDCKFFGLANARCTNAFRAKDPALWGGLEVGMRLRYMPTRSWYLAADFSMSSYLFSQSLAAELNFPLHASFNLGIPF